MSDLFFGAWQAKARDLHARAERLSKRIVSEARLVAGEAGLDPSAPFHSAHNATVGTPWRDVDLSLARKVLWLEKQSWEPRRMVDRILSRAWTKVPR